jgi:hypothetical protein
MFDVIKEVLIELGKMFFGEPRMAIAILALIALAWAVAHYATPHAGGLLLLIGCLAILAENVFHTAHKSRR